MHFQFQCHKLCLLHGSHCLNPTWVFFPHHQVCFCPHTVSHLPQTPRRYRCLTFSVPEEKKHKFIALCKVNFFSQRDNLDPLTTFPGQMHLPYFGGSSTAVYVVDHQCDLSLTEAGGIIKLEADLRAEIMHWQFIDTCTGCVPWHTEFVELIIKEGSGCHVFKKDLSCAYRQIPVDPGDYHLLGFQVNGNFYFHVGSLLVFDQQR